MKKHWLISAAMFALVSTGAWAADDAAGTPAPATGARHARTLEEARKHAHEYADKLDKMTEAEYQQKQEKSRAWRAKWKTMTPEEKAAYKKERYAKRHHTGDTTAAAPAAAPSRPRFAVRVRPDHAHRRTAYCRLSRCDTACASTHGACGNDLASDARADRTLRS